MMVLLTSPSLPGDSEAVETESLTAAQWLNIAAMWAWSDLELAAQYEKIEAAQEKGAI